MIHKKRSWKSWSWKKSFFTLICINVITILTLLVLLILPVGGNIPLNKNEKENFVAFTVQTKKDDLTKLINHYIEKEGLDGPIDYFVHLSDEVELYGSLPVFNQEIELKMTFEAKALENGDLLLNQKSISIGQLNLPVSYVMKFIKQSYNLPEWVTIDPEKELVYVSLTSMKLKSDMTVFAEEFNLKRDKISLQLKVNTEK
jgi:uncharacterized protein YpmS